MPKRRVQRKDTDKVVQALAHPLRMDILRHSAKPLSAKELGELLGESLGNVAYHVRVLLDAGLLENVRRQQVRGSIQKFNRRSPTAKRELRRVVDDVNRLIDDL